MFFLQIAAVTAFLALFLLIFSRRMKLLDEEDFYKKKLMNNAKNIMSSNIPMKGLKKYIRFVRYSGSSLTALEIFGVKTVLALLIVLISAGIHWDIFMTVIFSTAGFFIPDIWLQQVRQKREMCFERQLSVYFDSIANYVQSGLSHWSAIERAIDNGIVEEPLKSEILLIMSNIRKDFPDWEAIKAVAPRIPVKEFKTYAFAVELHTKLGGNLGDSLINISDALKEKQDSRQQVRALTTESRLSSYVVGAVPLIVFIIYKAFNLFDTEAALHSTFGIVGYSLSLSLSGIGLLLTNKLSKVAPEMNTEDE